MGKESVKYYYHVKTEDQYLLRTIHMYVMGKSLYRTVTGQVHHYFSL